MKEASTNFVEDLPKEQVEVCDGCGARGYPHAPLKWKIENGLGLPADHYCDTCYWEFRKTDFAEEAVIRAIKLARLHELFTLKELQRAMADVSGLGPEPFARALEQGHANLIEERSDEDLQATYGPLAAKGRAAHGSDAAQAAWDAQGGKHVA